MQHLKPIPAPGNRQYDGYLAAWLLLVHHAVVLQPTRDVQAIRVMVCPVDDTALCIPFILTIERHSIATLQCFDTGSEVNVMGDKQGLTRCKSEDKALMAASVIVVRQNSNDHTFAANLDAASLSLVRVGDCIVGR